MPPNNFVGVNPLLEARQARLGKTQKKIGPYSPFPLGSSAYGPGQTKQQMFQTNIFQSFMNRVRAGENVSSEVGRMNLTPNQIGAYMNALRKREGLDMTAYVPLGAKTRRRRRTQRTQRRTRSQRRRRS